MIYQRIADYLGRSASITQFDTLMQDSATHGHIHNLNRSMKAVLLARTLVTTQKDIIFISPDDKTAEDYCEDLELLLGQDAAWFLPDYEVLPYEQRSPHYVIRAQRIQTLSRIFTRKPAVYSLSYRAFLRKIVHPEQFGKNLIHLKKGEEYNPDVLVSDLVGLGYENQFQVSKVGELARRGGIIDVYTPALNHPVRIEFFGDEIDSIRVFSISSQRSTGEELKELTIIPSREFSLHDIQAKEALWEKIHKDGFYEGIELDVSLLMPQTATFLDYFTPNNTLIFVDEHQFSKSYINEIIEEATELYAKTHAKYKKRILPKPEELFMDYSGFNRILKLHPSHFLSATWQEYELTTSSLEIPLENHLNLQGNLEELEALLTSHLQQDYYVILQSDNASQSKRMRDLLPDLEGRIDFTIGVLQKGFTFPEAKIAIFTDHEIFNRYRRKRKATRFSRNDALVDYESLKPGDYIVHISHGIGIYGGLKKLPVDGQTVECLTLLYAENDTVYVPTYQLSLVSKFVSEEGIAPTINKLGSKKWEQAKSRARKQIELIAEDLIKLYAERSLRKGIAFGPDTTWQAEMEESFIYEDTPDQRKATEEIKADMAADTPMERLLCGDVGFGKTEVAIRAAFKAVTAGWQVAVLVPTTLLAEQHYLVFKERLAQYPIECAMFSRFRSRATINRNLARIAQGQVDIAIGTHRLLSKDVQFKRLGLLIIDEEHRFGVRHKDRLRQLKSNVDTLYMSATPIPRTMYMALSKLKELSLIRTSPSARLPIRTVVVPYDEDVIKDAINREIDRGGQVFFLHNRVQTIDSLADDLRRLLPGVRFGIGHGQLPEKQLEEVMLDFAQHKFDVLIASTIIESGIDIPNANTIIVNRADTFGLAQLYQIRGRVGRSNRRAYAYLIIPPKLTEDSRKRLETLVEYESLGSGYQIAMRDMELRGAGSLLGTKQSGLINTIGFNYYNRMLQQAIEDIQEHGSIQPEEIEPEKRIYIGSDHYLPESFVGDDAIRLDIYQKMLAFTQRSDFDELAVELKDRFGEIPPEAMASLQFHKLRFLADKAKLLSFNLKGDKASFEFDQSALPPRTLITRMVQAFPHPISFDTTRNFRIVFTLASSRADKKQWQLQVCESMLDFLLTHQQSDKPAS
jgi:transcription-repair coupling factor (superfamily II helicase)